MAALGLQRSDTPPLPDLALPGTRLGSVDPDVARRVGLPDGVAIVAGMTDGCTAQLAAGAVHDGDTMGVLGTTLVLKAVSRTPVESADGAVYSHLAPDGRYWAGGASNSGAGVLAAEFPGEDLAALDQQVADAVATYARYPLAVAGERFPVADPNLPPLTDGEPQSRLDAYRALLEGVAFVERLGLEYRCLRGHSILDGDRVREPPGEPISVLFGLLACLIGPGREVLIISQCHRRVLVDVSRLTIQRAEGFSGQWGSSSG
jgi:xylulokinase